jgi:hypothetical protein
MRNIDTTSWKERAKKILAQPPNHDVALAAEANQFAVSLLTTLYGPESSQARAHRSQTEAIQGDNYYAHKLRQLANGVIQNTIAELDSDLIVQVRAVVAGEVISSMIGLAKETLAEGDQGSTNVAAVLAAAAFEETIRRMGEELGGITTRPKLEAVLGVLKEQSIIAGAQVGIAQSYLKFRNDALHADWSKIEHSQVSSCLAFVESLLLRHFA